MFCQKCGTQLSDGAKFCASCGAQSSGAQAPIQEYQAPVQEYQQPGQNYQQSYQQPAQNYQQPGQGYQGYQPPVMQGQGSYNQMPPDVDAQQNKAMGILAYLGILVLIPIFAAKESKFARFHANQGLVLALTEVAFAIVYSILIGILSALLFSTGGWGLFGIVTTLMGLLWLGFAVLAIIGIVNAAQGKMKPLPVIGSWFTIIK